MGAVALAFFPSLVLQILGQEDVSFANLGKQLDQTTFLLQQTTWSQPTLPCCVPFVMGLREVISSQTLPAMSGLGTFQAKERLLQLLLVRVTERGHHLPSFTCHF